MTRAAPFLQPFLAPAGSSHDVSCQAGKRASEARGSYERVKCRLEAGVEVLDPLLTCNLGDVPGMHRAGHAAFFESRDNKMRRSKEEYNSEMEQPRP